MKPFLKIVASGSLLLVVLVVAVGTTFTHRGVARQRRRLQESHDSPQEGKLLSLSLTNDSSKSALPSSLLGIHDLRSTAFADVNDGELWARRTKTITPFWISLHAQHYDPVRFTILDYGFFYEKDLTKCFYDILLNEPNPTVVDVGGNIGWFTLLSRSVGASVIVFEPNPLNVQRLEESLVLNGWDYSLGFKNQIERSEGPSVNIIHGGVWSEEGFLRFDEKLDNPGSSRIRMDLPKNSMFPKIPVYTLDNVTLTSSGDERNITLLKIDVEGLEFKVVDGAAKLIASGRVENILMEFTIKGKKNHYKRNRPMLQMLRENDYFVYRYGGFRGPSKPMNETLSDDHGLYIEHLLELCDTNKGGPGQLNLWWKKKNAG